VEVHPYLRPVRALHRQGGQRGYSWFNLRAWWPAVPAGKFRRLRPLPAA